MLDRYLSSYAKLSSKMNVSPPKKLNKLHGKYTFSLLSFYFVAIYYVWILQTDLLDPVLCVLSHDVSVNTNGHVQGHYFECVAQKGRC